VWWITKRNLKKRKENRHYIIGINVIWINIGNQENRGSRRGEWLRKCGSYISHIMLLLSPTWQSIMPLQLEYLCHIPWNLLPVMSLMLHHHGILKIFHYHQPVTLQFSLLGNLQNWTSHVILPSTFFEPS